MRFVLTILLVTTISLGKEPDKALFTPRVCHKDIAVSVMSKQEYLYNLAAKYNLRVSKLIQNNPDINHINYLLNGLQRYGIPERIGVRWVYQESGFDSTALSPKWAFGYCQIIPGTWQQLSCELGFDSHTTLNNIEAGMYYLRSHYDKFGRWDLALAAYNAGPFRKSLEKGRIPDFAETKEYVARILELPPFDQPKDQKKKK